jgi:GAF domain-containing protein
MRRRDKAGGKAAKTQRRKTLKRRNAPEAMPGHKSSPTDANEKIALLERRLTEALEQQAATSDVLKVISKSRGQLEPVFAAMLANATRICEAAYGAMWLREDGKLRNVAFHGDLPAAFYKLWKAGSEISLDSNVPIARAVRSGKAVVTPDLKDDPGYREGHPLQVGAVDLAGIRTLIAVPMVKEGEHVGGITIYRREVRPFTDKQIELVKHFAAQAVIAIENTRLFSELRESLQQQTATADVLKVISRSTFDLQAVFKALVDSAAQLCRATMANIALLKEDGFEYHAAYGFEPDYMAFVRSHNLKVDRGSVIGRAVTEERIIHLHDVLADPGYTTGWTLDAQKRSGFRTALGVPLLREGKPIGAMFLTRHTVDPFTQQQIDLVTTFATQAVIAIENTRLLNELRQRTDDLTESLEQQTATSEVLRVISSSPTNVQPVFDAIAESAVRLCDGQFSFVMRFDGKLVDFASYCGLTAEGLKAFRSILPMPASEDTAAGRAIVRRAVVEISDVGADPSYGARGRGLAKAVAYRSIAAVPLLHEGNPIGAIAVARANAGPFPKRQIVLLQAFADQAVIAIENVRLFDEVQARTLELAKSLEDLRTTQDRLVQTQKLALLGQLTAGIAHEIKNPLNFVNNFSGISAELVDELQDTLNGMPLDDKARTQINELTNMLKANFDKVVHHGKRADAIVKNMLQHSREGSGEHRVIDINALVEESLNLAWHGARAETQGFEIKLKQSFDSSAGRADVFPQDIRRALLNMISNGFYAAIKRGAELNGGDYEPTLAASTKDLGDRVEIRIRDNGTGMTPDVKEKMFNPFFTTKPTGEGTGLGLSISHDIIVKQHGGSIEVETQPDEFTEIRIVLPRAAVFV